METLIPAATAPATAAAGAASGARANLETALQLEVPLIVVLAEKPATLEEVLALREGSVIVFKKQSSELLDVLVNNRPIGAGKTIKVGERFGIHLRKLGNLQDALTKRA